ncbi:MAG: IclR family transcriptional regulator [Pseudooceanicola nanhaiensis]|uniref:IclR family transcriptional regulator n=1 Tax=Rhodobacterales TaxID=204455 RepID=UPI0040589013
MAAAKTKPANEIVSLTRGLNILRAFRSVDVPLGNKEIGDRTGLPKATVARLSHTLCEMGYLRHVGPHGQYHLGDKVTTLGHAVLRALPLRGIAEPMMQDFAARHRMSIALAIGDQADMIYLAYCSGPDTVTSHLRIGSALPMAASAIGRAYLWAANPESRAAHLAAIRAMAASEAEADATEADLAEHIAEVDRVGYSISVGGWRREVSALAVPVWLDRGATVLGMNCSTRMRGIDEAQFRDVIAPALLTLSSEIGQSMETLGVSFWDE